MGFFGRLYKAETLDTRFASKTGQRLPDAQPSKWNTPEYYFYCLCFLIIPALMVKSVYDVSGPWHPSYKRYENLLEPGWIPGRQVDNSDAQYRSFRDNIPYMALVVILHPILRKAYESFTVSIYAISIAVPNLTTMHRVLLRQRRLRTVLPRRLMLRSPPRHARNPESGSM